MNYSSLNTKHVIQTIDRYSAANIHEIISLEYDLDLFIDFNNKMLLFSSLARMKGSITHTFKSIGNATKIILDVRDIKVLSITDAAKQSYPKDIYPYHYIATGKNEQLVITLPRMLTPNKTIKLTISYETSTTATAINWIDASQTASNVSFVFTQCEAHHCRSLAPLQDTPAVKSRFNVTLKTEEKYYPLASAILTSQTKNKGFRVHKFVQKIPVPSYLLAIVAGDLVFRNLTEAIGIYAERDMIDRAFDELVHMKDFLRFVFSGGRVG